MSKLDSLKRQHKGLVHPPLYIRNTPHKFSPLLYFYNLELSYSPPLQNRKCIFFARTLSVWRPKEIVTEHGLERSNFM